MTEVFRFDADSYCMVHCRPNSDVVQMTSNIANVEVAEMMAEELKNRGGYVFHCVPAGVLVAALEMVKSNQQKAMLAERERDDTAD